MELGAWGGPAARHLCAPTLALAADDSARLNPVRNGMMYTVQAKVKELLG